MAAAPPGAPTPARAPEPPPPHDSGGRASEISSGRRARPATTSRSIRQITQPFTRTITAVSDSPVTRFIGWVSPLGWTVLVLGIVALVVGRWMHWMELSIFAAACLVLFLACLLLAIGRTNVTVQVDVDPERVRVGDPATGRVAVRNKGRMPKLPILVELPVGVSAARFVLPSLSPGKRHDELFVVPTARRGVIPIGPARTVQGDPLGLMRRTLDWTEVKELFVHPRTVAVETLGAGLLRDLEGTTTEDQSLSDLAFHALREYQPGDDRRYIHWRSSAKAGKLLVRQFLDTRRTHVVVMIDADPQSFHSGHGKRVVQGPDTSRDLHAANAPVETEVDVETAISIGSSIAMRVVADEQECTLSCADQLVSATPGPLMLDAMSRVRPGDADILKLALDTARVAPDASTAFVVTGPHRDFLQLQRALGQFASEVRKVVVMIDPTSEPGIKSASGLTILTLAELGDLRRLLATGVM